MIIKLHGKVGFYLHIIEEIFIGFSLSILIFFYLQ